MAANREVFVKITGKDGKPRIIDVIKENLKGLKGVESEIQSSTQKSNSYRTASYRAAEKDIAKMQKDRARWEKEIAREISKTDKLAANDKIKEGKRAANALIQNLRQMEKESKQSAQTSGSFFSKMMGASFFGNLAANAVTAFASKIAGIPSALRSVLDEAVKISQDRANALKGVASIADFFNIPQKTAQESIANLRLVKAGILDITDAATAYKNLIASGFTDDQAVKILERFSDAAAFGKQSALSFGEAISRAGEGIKNQNSALVDNVGLTKNLSVILKERGFELEDLSNAQTKQNALLALYNGIMVETQAQVGDADKITQGYTGAIAALDQAKKNLYGTIGDIITRNPELIALIKTTTLVLQGQTAALGDNASASRKNAQSMTSDFAYIASEAGAMSNYVVAAFKEAGNFIALALTGAFTLAAGMVSITGERIINNILRVANAAVDITNSVRTKFGFEGNVEQFEYKTGNSEVYEKGIIQSELLLKNIGRSWNDATKAANNYRNTYNRILNDSKRVSGGAMLGGAGGDIGLGMKTGGTTTGGGTSGGRSGGRVTEKSFQLSKEGQALVNAARKLGVSPLDLATIISFETGGTFNPNKVGGAGGNYRGLIQFGAEERKQFGVTPGQSFESQIETSVVNYFKTRFAVAGRKTEGASLLDLYTTVIAGNPGANKNAKDAFGTSAVSGVASMGKHRQGALKKFFGGSMQNIDDFGLAERVEETSKELIAEAIEKRRAAIFEYVSSIRTAPGEIESSAAGLGRSVLPQLTDGEKYLENLRESLNLNERITESTLRREQHLKVMQTLYEDSVQTQSEDLLNVEEQLGLLRRQNADAEFIRKRRLIDATEEQLNAELELSNLQDRLANTPVIDSNRIQIEQTRDLIDLKNRQTDAIIALNRAQLELSQKGVYSEVEANARVLENINQNVKSTTDIIADFKIGLSDSFFSALDAPFEKLEKRLDKLPSGVRELAQTFVSLGRDIIRAFSHKIILRLLGLDSGGGSSGGGFLSNIFGGLFGGGSPGGTPGFNPSSFTGGGSSGGGIGGILSGIFGGGGRAGGTLSHEGGHLSGGGVGGILGKLGKYVPFLGIGIGLLGSLFGGDPKRKADKKENLPALQAGFVDALAQLRNLVNDTKSLRVEPESALAKATELRQQIASGFGIQFQSKKYRKQAQGLIAGKLVEADAIIAQIREAADIAGAAGERRRRILPEFADGFAFSNFARRNGLLSGGIAGMDSLPALLMPGEIVANQRQQNKIRSMAGFDVFAYADIPNYPKPKKMAEGGFVGSGGGGFNANFEIKLVGVTINPGSRLEITNKETQKKQFIELYKDAKKNREI